MNNEFESRLTNSDCHVCERESIWGPRHLSPTSQSASVLQRVVVCYLVCCSVRCSGLLYAGVGGNEGSARLPCGCVAVVAVCCSVLQCVLQCVLFYVAGCCGGWQKEPVALALHSLIKIGFFCVRYRALLCAIQGSFCGNRREFLFSLSSANEPCIEVSGSFV